MIFIILIVSLIILTIIYRKMILAEIPSRIGKAQAIVPVLLGIASLLLSFFLFMGISYLLLAIGFTSASLPAVLRSIISALLIAGIPEEIAKLLMILLSLLLFRSKIRNVYEYILIGAAVGFGFTLLEEFAYGSGNLVNSVGRLITLAGHMIFGMIMAKHLGFAKYNKKTGKGSVVGEYAKAFLIPLAIHTIYDACTADNKLMASENDAIVIIGMVLSIASIIALFILQIKVIKDFKKNTEVYCAMDV